MVLPSPTSSATAFGPGCSNSRSLHIHCGSLKVLQLIQGLHDVRLSASFCFAHPRLPPGVRHSVAEEHFQKDQDFLSDDSSFRSPSPRFQQLSLMTSLISFSAPDAVTPDKKLLKEGGILAPEAIALLLVPSMGA